VILPERHNAERQADRSLDIPAETVSSRLTMERRGPAEKHGLAGFFAELKVRGAGQ
jgi:hypothetical protein